MPLGYSKPTQYIPTAEFEIFIDVFWLLSNDETPIRIIENHQDSFVSRWHGRSITISEEGKHKYSASLVHS